MFERVRKGASAVRHEKKVPVQVVTRVCTRGPATMAQREKEGGSAALVLMHAFEHRTCVGQQTMNASFSLALMHAFDHTLVEHCGSTNDERVAFVLAITGIGPRTREPRMRRSLLPRHAQ